MTLRNRRSAYGALMDAVVVTPELEQRLRGGGVSRRCGSGARGGWERCPAGPTGGPLSRHGGGSVWRPSPRQSAASS